MIGLRYHTPGDVAAVEATIPTGETCGGFPGPTVMIALDVGAGTAPLEVAVRALIEGGASVAPAPPPPVLVPNVTGNQWFFALADLGLSALWRKAVAVSKDKDQNRVNLISRDTPLLAADPLLVRVCANAGANPDGTPAIDPAKVFARALTEPT